jgi:hypothetical protein
MASKDDKKTCEPYPQISSSLFCRQHLRSHSRGAGERAKDLLQLIASNEQLQQSSAHVKICQKLWISRERITKLNKKQEKRAISLELVPFV